MGHAHVPAGLRAGGWVARAAPRPGCVNDSRTASSALDSLIDKRSNVRRNARVASRRSGGLARSTSSHVATVIERCVQSSSARAARSSPRR